MIFAELMAAANDSGSKTDRNPGQWTPRACQIWREAEPEMARLLEAALAWELTAGRRAQPADEEEVRERRRKMDAATREVLERRRSMDAATRGAKAKAAGVDSEPGELRVSTLLDTVGESFELNVTAAQEAGTLIGTAKPIIPAQGSV
jgi:hypothetical protein